MNLFCYSLAFDRADLTVREHYALDAHERGRLRQRFLDAGASEALTLCTCNRTEIYFVRPKTPHGHAHAAPLSGPRPAPDVPAPAGASDAPAIAALSAAGSGCKDDRPAQPAHPKTLAAEADFAAHLLAEFKGRPASEVCSAGVLYQNEQVAEHLFALACGLRSLIIGESEILGQLKTAYADAVAADTAGKTLNRVFQRAFSLAKQIRTGTSLGRFRVSVASVAVERLRRLLGDVNFLQANVLVWGTGTVGAAVVRALEEAGASPGTILSRRPEEVARLFPRWRVCGSEALPALAGECDALICATGAPHALIYPQHLKTRLPRLLLADLSVPRNIAADCATLPGVTLFTVDDLAGEQGILAAAEASEATASDGQETLAARLHEESLRFWRCALAGSQERCIARWRQQAHHWLEEEYADLDRAWPQMPPEVRERYRKFARSLMHRMLHLPSNALKRAIRDDLPCADYFTDDEATPDLD